MLSNVAPTRHGLLTDPSCLLALAQTVVQEAQRSDDAEETLQQRALRAAVASLLEEDPHGVLGAVLGQARDDATGGGLVSAAVLLIERMAWHVAASLDFDQPDGRVVGQRTFAIPLIVPGEHPLPLHLERRSDVRALSGIAASMARHTLVRPQASVVLLPYLYPAAAMRAMTPQRLFRLSLALRATQRDDDAGFDPTDPVWCCGTVPIGARAHPVDGFESTDGASVRLFFLIGAIADEPEEADAVFADPLPEYAPVFTAHLHRWSDGVAACVNRWLGQNGTFVSAPAAPRDALEDAERLLPAVHCAMTLEYELDAHGVLPRELDLVVTYHTCALPTPDTVHAVHLEFRTRGRKAKVFDLLWRRPDGAYDNGWAQALVNDVQATGVHLKDEHHARPSTYDVRFDPEELGVDSYIFASPLRAQ